MIKLSPQQIETAFEHWWPDLERAFTSVKQIGGDAKTVRPDRELLEEVLGIVREEARDSIETLMNRTDYGSLCTRWISPCETIGKVREVASTFLNELRYWHYELLPKRKRIFVQTRTMAQIEEY